MALFESALKNLPKDEIINLALDYENKFDSTLAGIGNELSDLKKKLSSSDQICRLLNW